MDLDDFAAAWAAYGKTLEKSLAIDERLLRETMLRKVRSALVPYVLGRVVEVILGVAVVGATIPVLAAHSGEPRYMLIGGAFAVFAIAMTAVHAYLLVRSVTLDYGGAVTGLQRDVEHLRRAEYRALKWAVLGGVVMWLPAGLVLFEVATGVDALARADLAWLLANLAFGGVVMLAGMAWSKRTIERADAGPRTRRLADALSGRGLRRSAAHLADLAAFEID